MTWILKALPALAAACLWLTPDPLAADLPEDSCFVLPRPAPGSAVDRLGLRVSALSQSDRDGNLPYRYVTLAAVLGSRAQGLADGVPGKRLTQSLVCRTDTGLCAAAERNAQMHFRLDVDGRLVILTRDMPVADYGDSDLASNLVHPHGTPTRFDLVRTRSEDCGNP